MRHAHRTATTDLSDQADTVAFPRKRRSHIGDRRTHRFLKISAQVQFAAFRSEPERSHGFAPCFVYSSTVTGLA